MSTRSLREVTNQEGDLCPQTQKLETPQLQRFDTEKTLLIGSAYVTYVPIK